MSQKNPSFPKLRLYAEADLPTVFGSFRMAVYRDEADAESAILISKDLQAGQATFVRIHSECFTGEVLGSLKCDCREQLNLALGEIQKRGHGAVIYLRQEGRGIGLGNKVLAYDLQNRGADTIEANHQLGFATDLRSFAPAAWILKERGIMDVELNTNNPQKIAEIEAEGIRVTARVPSLTAVNPFNEQYLKTKMLHLGHDLKALFPSDKKPE